MTLIATSIATAVLGYLAGHLFPIKFLQKKTKDL